MSKFTHYTDLTSVIGKQTLENFGRSKILVEEINTLRNKYTRAVRDYEALEKSPLEYMVDLRRFMPDATPEEARQTLLMGLHERVLQLDRQIKESLSQLYAIIK